MAKLNADIEKHLESLYQVIGGGSCARIGFARFGIARFRGQVAPTPLHSETVTRFCRSRGGSLELLRKVSPGGLAPLGCMWASKHAADLPD